MPEPERTLSETLRTQNNLPRPPLSQPDSAPGARQLLDELEAAGSLTPYQSELIQSGQRHRLVIGPYVLLAPLGAGGMGEVFRARHHLLDRAAAVKLIRPEHRSNAAVVTRFLREARALAVLHHPNIVGVYEVGGDGESLFLAMELLPGIDLASYLEQRGPLGVAEACELIRQAALGLQHAHEQGLVHRDIKPKNLLRSPDGQVKILDLGLALLSSASTLTQVNGFMGTADYIAPEQITSAHLVDIRADIYSLGCTLYHLLAGRTPYADAHPSPSLRAACHLSTTPPPIERFRPELPGSLAALLRRMMDRQRERRPETPSEVAAALAAFSRPDRPPQVGDLVNGWLLADVLDAETALFRAVKNDATAVLHLLPASVKDVPPTLAALAWLRHPSLVEVLECGLAEAWRRCYAVLKWESGPSLEEYLTRRGQLDLKKAKGLFLSLADGLASAHERNVYHGNLHSTNILRRHQAPPVLVDFTLGETSRRLLGEPTSAPKRFTAPEQLQGAKADARSDVYSLAAILYYALTYDRPERHEPARFDVELVPIELRDLLTRSLDARPERRPPHGAAFRDALRATSGIHAIRLNVPGTWRARPRHDRDRQEGVAVTTPTTVAIQPGDVYHFALATGARDADLVELTALRGVIELVHLDLSSCPGITDAGLTHISSLGAVKALTLRGCRGMTDAGLAQLKHLSDLRYLDLSECPQWTDAGLAQLWSCTGLQKLSLRGCTGFTDAGLAALRGLASLQELDLSGCRQLTDLGVSYCGILPVLRRLGLAECEQVTDGGLAALQGLGLLRQLDLRGCTGLTPQGLLAFRAALPQLDVEL